MRFTIEITGAFNKKIVSSNKKLTYDLGLSSIIFYLSIVKTNL